MQTLPIQSTLHTPTEDQKRQLVEQGFFITETLFEEPVLRTLRSEFHRVWNEEVERSRTLDARQSRLVRERPFLDGLHHRSADCAAFFRHPALLAVMRGVIGGDVDVCYNQAVLKAPIAPGAKANAFAWHQDHYYGFHGSSSNQIDWEAARDPRRSFQGWVAVTRTTIANGTLWVLPGRHREGFLLHHEDPETGEWVGDYDTSDKIAVELEPGQMLVFSGMLPHSSGPNYSGETRMVYQFWCAKAGTRRDGDFLSVMRAGIPQAV